ncbi:hypothetical protein E2I00_017500, partial [Balaenoptera physalus]
ALTSWRLHLFPLKVPAKVESSFNVLEIRAFNTLSQNQVSTRAWAPLLGLSLIRRGNADTPEGPRDTSQPISCPTGGFSETYAALCDYNGLHCREEVQWVLHTLSKSGSLEELVLDNAGLKTDFVQKLAGVFGENGSCFLSLSQQLLCFPTGLTKLCLAKTAISPRGLQALGQTFGANPAFASSLQYLDLSKNPGLLATDEANFFSSTYTLSHINLSATRLPLEALRTLEEILHKLVQLIQEEDCSLSVADSRLKLRTSILINALGSNTCLAKVDLSGNGMEDIGAKMLSKALQINSSLRTILWDRNNTSALGFLDIARALESNHTLRFMSFPVSDISQAYRSAPERTEDVWQKEQAFRLQQGLVTSSAEQRLCGRVQEEVRALRLCPLEPVQDELLYARDLIKDAKNSRALFPSLYELGHMLANDGPVILESMVSLTQELCPVAMRVAEGHNKMLSNVAERLSVVTYLTNSIVDEILQELYHSHKSLVKILSLSPAQTCPPPRITRVCPHQPSPSRSWAIRQGGCAKDRICPPGAEDGTMTDTMAIKKQKRCRKIRPVSAFISESSSLRADGPDSLSFISASPACFLPAPHASPSNAALPTGGSPQDVESQLGSLGIPPGWFSGLGSSQPTASGSWEGLSELPTHGYKLRHQTQGRPRPPRTTPPGPGRPSAPVPGTRQENGTATRLDEGLEDFFSRRGTDGAEPGEGGQAPGTAQQPRVHSVALPGLGGAKGWSFDGKREGPGPDLEGSVQPWQKRRSSDDAGPGAWKPPPPPQSTKPSFSAMRRAEATWHIAEESAPNHSCQSPSPASQDGEEEKEGALFPERTVPARNAKDQEEPEVQGPPDLGRRTAPLKPKRTRRAQSCDKLEPDRRQPPDPTGARG